MQTLEVGAAGDGIQIELNFGCNEVKRTALGHARCLRCASKARRPSAPAAAFAALQMSVHLDSIISTLSHAPLAKLSFKSINKARLERAAAAVVEHTNLSSVDLSHNSITCNDAAHIAHIIKSAPHVERLNISCNDFSGAEGCRLIAAALQENSVSFNPPLKHSVTATLKPKQLAATFGAAGLTHPLRRV
jgi:hypothetical protein